MHLLESRGSRDVVCFYLCCFDDDSSLEADTIIGCLLRQMASNLPAEAFQAFWTEAPSRSRAIDFVKEILRRDERYSVVLDGLDEMQQDQQMQILNFLQEFSAGEVAIRALLTARPSTTDYIQTWARKLDPQMFLFELESVQNRPHVDLDINKYVVQSLESLLSEGRPDFLGRPELILRIRTALSSQANGM